MSAVGGPVDDDDLAPWGPPCPAEGSLLRVSELEPRDAEDPGPNRIGLTEPLFLQEGGSILAFYSEFMN